MMTPKLATVSHEKLDPGNLTPEDLLPEDDRVMAGLPLHGRMIEVFPPPVVEAEPEEPETGTGYTDLGNGRRFVEEHGQSVRCCAMLGGWYVWDGARWARDDVNEARNRAQRTADRIYLEVEELAAQLAQERDKDRRAVLEDMLEECQKHAKRSAHTSRITATLTEASALPPIPVAQTAFDAEPTNLLLNTPNGTVDLTAGTMRPHQREQLITKVTGARFDPQALAPRFDAFLSEILPDSDVRAFMKRWAGYCATGVIREHVLPIWYGTGANGKSTLSELLRRSLGSYAMKLNAGYFEATKHRGHETEVAQLRGARLAIASETERAADLAEGKIKDLTGGEAVRGRYMRCDHFEFMPSAKFVMLTNHKPQIRSTDDGIRRRIVLVPFEVTVPPERRDLSLLETLLAEEGPGILRWIVEGARELLAADGRLDAPAVIQAATDSYLASEDVVGRFLEEACTVRTPGDRLIRSRPASLFGAFERWCVENGEPACTSRDFSKRLGARGYVKRKSNGKTWYLGIAPAEEEAPRYGG